MDVNFLCVFPYACALRKDIAMQVETISPYLKQLSLKGDILLGH